MNEVSKLAEFAKTIQEIIYFISDKPLLMATIIIIGVLIIKSYYQKLVAPNDKADLGNSIDETSKTILDNTRNTVEKYHALSDTYLDAKLTLTDEIIRLKLLLAEKDTAIQNLENDIKELKEQVCELKNKIENKSGFAI